MRSRSLTAPISEDVVRDMTSELMNYTATVRNCPMFLTHFKESSSYVFWTPWQPPETLTKWSAHLPCQNEFFCDGMFPLEESRSVAQTIYSHQHPHDCTSAKYLVITNEWGSGFASAITLKARMLLAAIAAQRVLIDAEDNRWKFTHPESCSVANMACYFAPLTHCKLPIDWKRKAKPFKSLKDTSQFATSDSALVPARGVKERDLQGFGYDHKPIAWWSAHASVFIRRPNLRSLRATCFTWNCIMRGRLQPDRPFASMFVRAGDKFTEATPREPHEYFTGLWSLSHSLNEPVRSVYVGSDSALVLNRILQDYRDDWNLSWMGHFRGAVGQL